jgi:hypothetical protein
MHDATGPEKNQYVPRLQLALTPTPSVTSVNLSACGRIAIAPSAAA